MNITLNTDNSRINNLNKNTKATASQNEQADTTPLYDTYEKSEEEGVVYPKYQSWGVGTLGRLGDEVYSEDFQWFSLGLYDVPSPLGVLYLKIPQDIHKWLLDYYQGKCTMDKVLDSMELCCARVIDYWNTTNPDKLTSDFKKKIVSTVYEAFLYDSSFSAVGACKIRGRKLCSDEFNVTTYNYAYYSSEIYYDWKAMKNSLAERADIIGNSLGDDKADYASQKPDCKILDFHEAWNASFCLNSYVGRIINTSEEPPRNLVVFYEGMSNNFSGRVFIETSNGKYDLDVPFSLKLENQNMDMESLFRKWRIAEDERYMKFLKNILFFTKVHGHTYQKRFI